MLKTNWNIIMAISELKRERVLTVAPLSPGFPSSPGFPGSPWIKVINIVGMLVGGQQIRALIV